MIFPNLTAYSFVAVGFNQTTQFAYEYKQPPFVEIFEQYDIVRFCLAPETSEKGRFHWQGIIWTACPFDKKTLQNFRNKFTRFYKKFTFYDKFRSKLSVVLAKKPNSLISYVLKQFNDHHSGGVDIFDGLITNLDMGQILLIPKWVDKVTFRKRKWEKFIELLKIDMDTHDRHFEHFNANCLKHYKSVFKTPPHTRAIYIKAALAIEYISGQEYARMIGVNWNIINIDPNKINIEERKDKQISDLKKLLKSTVQIMKPYNKKLFSLPST